MGDILAEKYEIIRDLGVGTFGRVVEVYTYLSFLLSFSWLLSIVCSFKSTILTLTLTLALTLSWSSCLVLLVYGDITKV